MYRYSVLTIKKRKESQMNLSTLHEAVRGAVRGDNKMVSVSGFEGEALQAWRTRLKSIQTIAISSAREWGEAPTPIVLAQ
jgi:hypothetical protein